MALEGITIEVKISLSNPNFPLFLFYSLLIPKKPTTGVQFVKPRIYQTGGGEWKSVNYENPEDLSLKQKLKMLGIDHEEGTKERFHLVAQRQFIDAYQ